MRSHNCHTKLVFLQSLHVQFEMNILSRCSRLLPLLPAPCHKLRTHAQLSNRALCHSECVLLRAAHFVSFLRTAVFLAKELQVRILFQLSTSGLPPRIRPLIEMFPSRHKLFNGVHWGGRGAVLFCQQGKALLDWRNLEFRHCLVNFALLLYLTC